MVAASARGDLIAHADFGRGQRAFGIFIGERPVEHCQPEDAPTEYAANGDEVDQALGGTQLELFGIAAGFEDFEEQLDLPEHRILGHLLNGLVGSFDRRVGQQLPINGLAPFGRIDFSRIYDGQAERGIAPRLSNRR